MQVDRYGCGCGQALDVRQEPCTVLRMLDLVSTALTQLWLHTPAGAQPRGKRILERVSGFHAQINA